ncbi:MAG: adenylate/guanylate cyclase domain-containing protein [Spirochaetales bacterium]|nr:adenylate/guanylate cyclase domain-containing protein [Spirochaetales bacterium]
MKLFKTDIKTVLYASAAILVLLLILSYFVFGYNLEKHVIKTYLPEAKTDAVSISRSQAFKDLMTVNMLFVLISIIIFILSFIFPLVAYILFIKRPFFQLRLGFQKVKEGDFDTRLTVKGFNEVASLFDNFNEMVKACRKKISIKHYVSGSTEQMVEVLRTGEITIQPRRKLVTVFFSDVRGFTTYAEEMDPLMVINTLNEIFCIQVQCINKNSGDIDKFIGDEIMVQFPSPSCAFKCALEIQQKIASFNKKRKETLQVGIGINYGVAVVGAVGSGEKYDFTMIGNTVNVGRRLCSAAEPGSIVVSESAYEKLKTKRPFTEIDIKVKGISKKVTAFVFNDGE